MRHLASRHRFGEHELVPDGLLVSHGARRGRTVLERHRAHGSVEYETHSLGRVPEVSTLAVQQEPQAQLVQSRVVRHRGFVFPAALLPQAQAVGVGGHERRQREFFGAIAPGAGYACVEPAVIEGAGCLGAVQHPGVLAPVDVVPEHPRVQVRDGGAELGFSLEAPRRLRPRVHGVAQPVGQRLDRVGEVGRHLHGLVREGAVHAALLKAKVSGQRLGDGPKSRGDAGLPLVGNFRSGFAQVVVEAWSARRSRPREFDRHRPQPQHPAHEVAKAKVSPSRRLGRARRVDAGDDTSPPHLDAKHGGVRPVEKNFPVKVGNRQQGNGEENRVQQQALHDVHLSQHRICEVAHRQCDGPRAAQARGVADDGGGAHQDAHGKKSRAEEDHPVREIRRIDRVGKELRAEQVVEHDEGQLNDQAVREDETVPVHHREPWHGPRREIEHPLGPHERWRCRPVAHHRAHDAGDGGGEHDYAAERGLGDVLVDSQRRTRCHEQKDGYGKHAVEHKVELCVRRHRSQRV